MPGSASENVRHSDVEETTGRDAAAMAITMFRTLLIVDADAVVIGVRVVRQSRTVVFVVTIRDSYCTVFFFFCFFLFFVLGASENIIIIITKIPDTYSRQSQRRYHLPRHRWHFALAPIYIGTRLLTFIFVLLQ